MNYGLHIYKKIILPLLLLLAAIPASTEPLFDNNGYTVRDKIKTVAVGYSQRQISFKNIGVIGFADSTQKIEATCIDLGYAFPRNAGTAFFLQYSFCDEVGIFDGIEEAYESGRVASLGYIYSSEQSPVEMYIEAESNSFPAVGFKTISFDRTAILFGLGYDLFDGQRFSFSLGLEADLVNFGEGDVGKKSRPYMAYARSSYLFDGDWAISLRLGGYGREGLGLSLMKSF